ncbi:MAG: hypothetical protein DU429_02905 [Candidatus Tokpelaia sp.]|nr:MAG: hypothetical protein DU430_05660 [Candidatus Tokpelaia sp.]KAA6207416.1 MAG: hypothetical protein DU429_02905 [Candidatus Tokpelaia sp.]
MIMEVNLKKILIALFATAGVVAGVSAASAETSTGNLTVKATLTEGCGINFGAGNNSVINFGSVYDLTKKMEQTGRFSVGCSSLKGQTNTYAATSVSLDQGDVKNSTVANRLLSNGSDTLQFQVFLYGEGSSDIIWGDGSGTTQVYPTPVTNGQPQEYEYRVRLLPQTLTDKAAGLYQNTMVATVTYTATAAN